MYIYIYIFFINVNVSAVCCFNNTILNFNNNKYSTSRVQSIILSCILLDPKGSLNMVGR